MSDRLQVNVVKRVFYRGAAIVLVALAVIGGVMLAVREHSLWPLLVTGFLGFTAYGLWIKTCWSLEIGADGITLCHHRKQIFIPWSQLGEFAPGNGIDRHKVEFSRCGEPPLAHAYQGMARLKLRNARFLPDTFGMSASALADLLNQRKRESAQQR